MAHPWCMHAICTELQYFHSGSLMYFVALYPSHTPSPPPSKALPIKETKCSGSFAKVMRNCLRTTLCIVLGGKIQFILPLVVVSHVSLQTFETVSSFTYNWTKKPNACLNTNNTIADIFILLKLAVIHIEFFPPNRNHAAKHTPNTRLQILTF